MARPIGVRMIDDVDTSTGVATLGFSDIIFIYGTEGDDVISWQGGPVVIQGLGGNDQIYGSTGGNGFLSGDAGNDYVASLGANDHLFGGDGDDTLVGFVGGGN